MSYQARSALTDFSTAMTTFCRMEQSQRRTLIESLPYSAYQAILSQRVLNQNVEETGLSIASCYGTIPKGEFIKTLKSVSLALMKPIYRDLQDPLLVEQRHELTGRLIDAITELEFSARYPADARLLQAVGETDPQKFAQIVQPLALAYLQGELAERLAVKGVTEIPSVHNFSSDPDLGSLNYVFSQAVGEQQDVFPYLGIALDMTGCAYEDPKLLAPLMGHCSLSHPA
ncbi:MAG: hypothetical protein KBF91_05610 [Alphaproteobacteria bacterium]|nr:hypothetical protein [Alphaproteobacteria bacterium]